MILNKDIMRFTPNDILPEKKIEALRRFKAVLTPDFSMFGEMPIALQVFSTFKNR